MANASSIEWTDATWNPVAGCSPVSTGCKNCYAARMALRLSRMENAAGVKYANTAKKTRGGLPVFTGHINLDRSALDLPKQWRQSRTIFVNSMSDLFHEGVPLSFIQDVFGVMVECSHHTFQVLTKRPERALELAARLPWPSNVWLGTSIESADVLDRVSSLARTPAQLRFLSCEPLLGPLPQIPLLGIDWVIVGGESGPGSRPIQEQWIIDIRQQCEDAGALFFFKQWGGTNKKAAGRTLEGRQWDDRPSTIGRTTHAQ